MRYSLVLITLLALLVPLECSDGEGQQPDAASPDVAVPDVALPDVAIPDIAPPDAAGPDVAMVDCPNIGKFCKQHSDCGGGICLQVTKAIGICSCTCEEDTVALPGIPPRYACPDKYKDTGVPKNVCGAIASKFTQYCFKICNPRLGANDCPAGVACHPKSAQYSGTFGRAVCLLPGCTKDSDCPHTTGVTCDTTKKNCPPGQVCQAITTGGTKGLCAKDGKCDKVSGLCYGQPGKSGVPVGAPCKGDTDCGPNQECLLELDDINDPLMKKSGSKCTNHSECCSSNCTSAGVCSKGPCVTHFRNGYCVVTGCKFSATLTHKACPGKSVCNNMYYGGLCQKKCALASKAGCRNNPKDYYGDYECRAWNKLSIGGTSIVSAPVCDFGTRMRCDIFGTGASLSCDTIGDSGNSTNMGCFDLKAKSLPKSSAIGFCLDNTTSGAVKP